MWSVRSNAASFFVLAPGLNQCPALNFFCKRPLTFFVFYTLGTYLPPKFNFISPLSPLELRYRKYRICHPSESLFAQVNKKTNPPK